MTAPAAQEVQATPTLARLVEGAGEIVELPFAAEEETLVGLRVGRRHSPRSHRFASAGSPRKPQKVPVLMTRER